MILNRRQFVLLSVGLASGCSSLDRANRPEQLVNTGSAGNYAADGTYAHFRNSGFFIVRQGNTLVALSSFCTHRRCRLNADSDHSFHCPCHGSRFNPLGHVMVGPAKRDLPVFVSYVDEHGNLLVKVPAS